MRRTALIPCIACLIACFPFIAGAVDSRAHAPGQRPPAYVRLHPDSRARTSSAPAGSRPHATASRSRLVPQEKIRVVDGDTFRNGRERVRIIGFDAPEMSQARGPAAKTRMSQLLRSGTVTMVRHGKDKYGRTLALVYVNGTNVADTMRAEGFVK